MPPEVLTPEESETERDRRLALRRPEAPVTLTELSSLKGEALEIIEARVQILSTLRKAALRATSPEDWILHKAPEDAGGQVVGYLQDSGCERVRDLFGINIFDVSTPEKIAGTEPGVFHYIISGSGRCNLTKQIVENVEGGRSSTDDICRDKKGAELELLVRKSARANLDGRIVRELAGLSSVPIIELEDAWQGTNKKSEHCRRGRGFGTRSERLGANKESAPDVEPPICKYCNSKMVYRQGKNGRGDFYGCPNYQKHENQKFTVDAAKWLEESKKKTAAAPASTPAAADPAPQTAAGPMPTADEVFKK